jgi:hypothetical protein
LLKNLPASSLLRHSPELLKYQAWWLHESVRDGWAPTLLRAWGGALLTLPRTMAKRRAIQSAGRVGPARLEMLIEPHPTRAELSARDTAGA